jgi:quinone-modifying oxidoreductase, subunit QmoA
MCWTRRLLRRDACGDKAACKYDAVDLDMQPETFTINVGSIIWATGWDPYDASKMDNLKFGQSPPSSPT